MRCRPYTESARVQAGKNVKELEGVSPYDHWLNVSYFPTQNKLYNALPPWDGGIAGRSGILADVYQYPGLPGQCHSKGTLYT